MAVFINRVKLLYHFFLVILLTIILVANCKLTEKKQQEKEKYDRFDDYYKNNKYVNTKLNFSINFSDDWNITAKYEQFDYAQKSYANYFSSIKGEVLFAGYNDDKKMGIRATCEQLGMTNDTYFESLTTLQTDYSIKYNLKSIINEEVLLKNIKVKHIVVQAELNRNNIFILDSVLFTLNKDNIKIDIWVKDKSYEDDKNYIYSIFDSIDITKAVEETSQKTESDIKKTNGSKSDKTVK